MRALVSVIIPSYNMAEYLSASLDSALNAGVEDVEVIVVDDGSTDETESVISQYIDPSNSRYDPRIRYIRQSNQGKPGAVNSGLSASKGRFITILDADDMLPTKGLSMRCKALEDEKKDLAIGGFEVVDERGATVGSRPIPDSPTSKVIRKQFCLSYKSPFHLGACLFSRSLYNKVGAFDKRLQRCQDIDYSLRLLREAKEIAWVDKAVYQYRKYRGSYLDRAKVRLRTLWHRPAVYWKNYRGGYRYIAVFVGVALDTGKLVYESIGNYKS